nr:immunoglobulin light chain junction region [Macaca mulatta]MOX28137.1 immunoglobulin light chain junction region [Macaca mulatta]MOX28168.1 immunoglobulin light chain junction region [Macaca mulatta]MOX28199.1 immunoglobulin light chain junction region [Macaca mulatta]MOX28219.1 immunoglobulin light chain junction region [Macaca mulatta]
DYYCQVYDSRAHTLF